MPKWYLIGKADIGQPGFFHHSCYFFRGKTLLKRCPKAIQAVIPDNIKRLPLISLQGYIESCFFRHPYHSQKPGQKNEWHIEHHRQDIAYDFFHLMREFGYAPA